MFTYLRHATTPIWLFLVLATSLSWWLGHAHGLSSDPRLISSGLIVIAAIKIRLVVAYFMEVRDAPRGLRLTLDAWLLLMVGSILGIYWLGSH